LYDNAEDLLNESLKENPDRADYRAKLLDTYFATKNKDAFIKEAEALKSLGGAADRFWDRVQIMGFELTPDNTLFSGAKDSDVSAQELEYAKPESADFDIGAEDEATDFSNTDFDLGSEDSESFNLLSTQVVDKVADEDFSETQSMDGLDIDFPDLGDDLAESDDDELSVNDVNLEDNVENDSIADAELDISDEIDESEDLDISEGLHVSDEPEMDVDLDLGTDDEDAISFDLPDELEVSEEGFDPEIIELEPTVEAPPNLAEIPELDEDGVELDLSEADDQEAVEESVDEDDLTSETVVISKSDLDLVNNAETESVESEEEGGEIPLDDELDFDMTDMDSVNLQTGDFTPSDTVALDQVNEDDITEFMPADITGEFVAMEVDAEAGLDKTGTFAPGDFNEEDMAVQVEEIEGVDDIEDLMLPDDVDEVGTKLDLAKAFIDMGDAEGARSSLEEVMSEGTVEQKAEATGLIEQIK